MGLSATDEARQGSPLAAARDGSLHRSILMISGNVRPLVLLGAALLTTMAITPVLNNAATVVIMAPIVVSLAARTGVLPDAFLMAVAIGA